MKSKEKVKEELGKAYFGKETLNYDYNRSKDLRRKYILERKTTIIKSFLKNVSGKKILDVACGTGRFFYIYKSKKIHGIDISKDQLSEAKKKSKNAVLKVADATKIPFPDNFFDVVITSQFIEHIPQYKEVISEMVRVCKKNGTIIIDFPNKYSLTYLPTKFRILTKKLRWLNLFSRRDILNIAKELNLEIVDWDYTVVITPNIFPDTWTPVIKKLDRFLYKIIKQRGYLHYVKFKKR